MTKFINSTALHPRRSTLLKIVRRSFRKIIQERNYNVDFKNPNDGAKVEHTDPKKVLENIATAENQIAKILEEIKKEI